MKTLLLLALLAIMSISNFSYAQVKKTPTPVKPSVEFTVLGGMLTPTGSYGDSYLMSVRTGLDAGYRLNKEVTLYMGGTYTKLRSNITNVPSSSLISIVAGPRYIFTNPKLRSNFFMEGGVGAFFQNTPAYTNNAQTIESQSSTNLGFNAGIGGLLTVSNSVDVFIRSKYNLLFQKNGSAGFLATDAGLTFKL